MKQVLLLNAWFAQLYAPGNAADLWDMTEARKQSLDVEIIGARTDGTPITIEAITLL